MELFEDNYATSLPRRNFATNAYVIEKYRDGGSDVNQCSGNNVTRTYVSRRDFDQRFFTSYCGNVRGSYSTQPIKTD